MDAFRQEPRQDPRPCLRLILRRPLLRSSPMMMMMTFITRRGEGQGKTKKERKATKSKGRGLEEGASRALLAGTRELEATGKK